MNATATEKKPKVAMWYLQDGPDQRGPLSSSRLRAFARSGQLTPETMVWREGLVSWIPAGRLDGLKESFAPNKEGAKTTKNVPGQGTSAQSSWKVPTVTQSLSRGLFNGFVCGVRQWDVKRELFPLNVGSFHQLGTDARFWSVALLAGIPLLIGTLEDQKHQLLAFALFFAGLWGVIFRYFLVRPENDAWKWWIGSLLFTGVAGIWGLLSIYTVLPSWYLNLSDSENVLVQLIGSVMQTGVCEELTKSIPVVAYIYFCRDKIDAKIAVMIGVFSGLGFAAFENVHYGNLFVQSSLINTYESGAQGLVQGVRSAMVYAMLRAISLVFCHAVFAGITAYFLITAVLLRRHLLAAFAIGIAITSTLHGCFNWLSGIQPTIASTIAVSYTHLTLPTKA